MTNNTNWVCAYSSSSIQNAEIAADILKQEGIEAVIVNKQDSFYKFGEIEVYVSSDEILKALQIIKSLEL